MIEANTKIFDSLDEYCAKRDSPIANAGSPRWISTAGEDNAILKYGQITESLMFSPTRRYLRVDHDSDIYFCLIGFEYYPLVESLLECEINGSLLTLILSEAMIQPKASPAEIKDIVEYSDKSTDAGYAGHDFAAISTLFPRVHILKTNDVDSADTHRIFFLMSLGECEFGDYWINYELSHTLKTLCELEISNIPYKMLCRSVFDSDPGAMFLALYRCIEAIYSYTSAKRMIDTLSPDYSPGGMIWLAGVDQAVDMAYGFVSKLIHAPISEVPARHVSRYASSARSVTR